MKARESENLKEALNDWLLCSKREGGKREGWKAGESGRAAGNVL